MSSGQKTWPDNVRSCATMAATAAGGPGASGYLGWPTISDHAVLGQRAGGPGFLAPLLEPMVRGVMSDMRRINKGDDDVDVEQECQGDSSRSALTVSSVTTTWPARRGRSCIPLRVAEDSGRRKARRARSDTTSPRLRFCCLAMALAAINTSSSMASVVRICRNLQSIKHQTSNSRIGVAPQAGEFARRPKRLPRVENDSAESLSQRAPVAPTPSKAPIFTQSRRSAYSGLASLPPLRGHKEERTPATAVRALHRPTDV